MLTKRESRVSEEIFFSDESVHNEVSNLEKFPHIATHGPSKSKKVGRNFRGGRQIIDLYRSEVRQNYNDRKHSAHHQSDELLKDLNAKFLQKNYPEAILICHDIIAKFPNLVEPYNILHLIYEETGDMKMASDFLFMKLQLEKFSDPDVCQTWAELGARYFSLEEYRSAIYCYTRAFKNNPLNAEALLRKAECYERLDDFGSSLKVYEKYLIINPSNKNLLKKVARLYTSLGKKIKSLSILLRLLSTEDFMLNPDLNILNMVLEIFIKLKQYPLIITYLELFVTAPESFTRFSKAMYHKLEGNELTVVDSLFETSGFNKIESQNQLSTDQIFYFLENLPIDLIHTYIKSLILVNEQEKVLSLLDRIGRESLMSCEDLFADYLATLLESKNQSLIKNEDKAIKDLFDKMTPKEKVSFLYFEAEVHRLYGKLRDQLKCLTQLLSINPKETKARMRLSRIFQRRHRKRIALDVLNEDEAASKISAKFRLLNENISLLSADRNFSKDNDSMLIDNLNNKKEGKRPEDQRIVTKLIALRVFNEELRDMIGKRISKINRTYNKDNILILNERVKLYGDDEKDEKYYSILEKLLTSSLSLEDERRELEMFLKQKLLMESNKDLVISLLNFYEKGKGILIYNHKKRKQKISKSIIQKQTDETEQMLNERELILRKKKFFVKKLVKYFLGEIFSLVDFLGFESFSKYLEEILKHLMQRKKLEVAQKLLGLFLTTKSEDIKDIRDKVKWQLKYFVICYNIRDFDQGFICLRQIMKDLTESKKKEINIEEREFRQKSIKLMLLYVNGLLPLIKDHSITNMSYLQKILKEYLNNRVFESVQIDLQCAIQITIANVYFYNDSFDLALKYYRQCRKAHEDYSLASLMASLCLLLKTASRNNFEKGKSFQESLEEFKLYAESRGMNKNFEVQYNFGRALAFVGDFRHACEIFHTLLDQLEYKLESELSENVKKEFKVKVQSALNLYAIYKHTGNGFLGNRIIDKYLSFN